MKKQLRLNLIDDRTLAIKFVLVLVILSTVFSATHAHALEPLYKVLQTNDNTARVWKQVRDLVNVFVIAGLIFIAFANILRINLNNYAIKKFLPALLMAVILANFSYFICRLMVDVANVALSLLMDGTTAGGTINGGDGTGVAGAFNFTNRDLAKNYDPALFWRYGWYILAEFVGAVFILILSFLFYIRNYVIYFLVAMSPLAFMATILPNTKTAFNQWWGFFWKWTFLPVVSVFWLWLGGMWFDSGWNSESNFNSSIFGVGFATACYYLAITTPFKMGGAIMSGWGNLGKKAWGLTGGQAVGEAQRYGKLWMSKQAASENKFNMLGHLARIAMNTKMRRDAVDKITDDNWNDKAAANIARSKSGKSREVALQKLGGEFDKAKKEAMAEYQETEAGRKWMNNRQRWLDELSNTDKRIEKNFNKAGGDFRESAEGLALAADRLRLAQEALAHEDRINAIEKKTLTDFFKNKDVFNNPEDLQLLNLRMLNKTRNLRLDEAVKKSEQDYVDQIYQDQSHIANIKSEIEDRNKLLKANNWDENELNSLIQRMDDEANPLTSVEMDRYNLLKKMKTVDNEVTDLTLSALKFYNKRSQDDSLGGAPWLQGMVNPNGSGTEEIIKGFAGLPDMDPSLEGIMISRTGKLMSLEIRGDIEKILGEKTVDEIAADLDPRLTTLGKKITTLSDGSEVTPEVVLNNFRNGLRHLNDPAANREIEARILALAQVAKQTSNADSMAAASRLAAMMSDDATISAAEAFNRSIRKALETASGGSRERLEKALIETTMSPEQMRGKLESVMTGGGQNARIAYSSVMKQPSMGVSKNPAEYLSTVDETASGYRAVGPQEYHPSVSGAMSGTAALIKAMAGNQQTSFSQLSRTLADSLGEPIERVSRFSKEMSDHLRWQKTNLAKDFAKQLGISLPETMRPALVESLSKLPLNATSEQITQVVQQVAGATPQISDETKISLTQPTGGQASVNLEGLISKAKNIEAGIAGVKLLESSTNVDQHMPYIKHFQESSPEQAQKFLETLSAARAKIEDVNTPADQIASIAQQALSSTGYAVSGSLDDDPLKLIDHLLMAHNAASAASKAYDESGKFDINRAVDTLVTESSAEGYHKGLEERRGSN